MTSIFLLIIYIALLFVGIAAIRAGSRRAKDARHLAELEKRLSAQGVTIDAQIVSKRTAFIPGGRVVTPHYYIDQYKPLEMQTDATPQVRAAEIPGRHNRKIKVGDVIKVRYMPDDPAIVRFAGGLPNYDTSTSRWLNSLSFYFAGVAVILLSILFIILLVGSNGLHG